MDIALIFQLVAAIIIALFVAYNFLHYALFLLVTQPKDASKIGHELNQFEQRQLIEWTPHPSDFLKHDDEKRTYDDVFGTYRDEQANYSTCVFPRVAFSRPSKRTSGELPGLAQSGPTLHCGGRPRARSGH